MSHRLGSNPDPLDHTQECARCRRPLKHELYIRILKDFKLLKFSFFGSILKHADAVRIKLDTVQIST